ncbi:MAG TPA: histidine phosphatase family protein [Anaeromyxobacter sp.]|nr:histidine phosphatase family protein [Anaeromyxobacter sp.]
MLAWLAPAVALSLAGAGEVEAAELWALLARGDQVIVIRHASTDAGVGDPPGFRLGDCATQRNLSAEGRAEAVRLGAALRARGVPVGRVLSSRWCRCLDTARLAFGEAHGWPPLDSIFEDRSREREQTAAVRGAIAAHGRGGGTLVLVTHGANVAALTGIHPAPGELLVLTPSGDDFTIRGRLAPAALEASR